MEPYRILLVEDDQDISSLIKKYLSNEGYQVEHTADGAQALKLAQSGRFDLIILDLMVPSIDGLSILVRVRETLETPVIILSSRREETDKVTGLGLGADDYMTKPFSMPELSARVKARLRRKSSEGKEQPTIRISDLELDCGAYTVRKRGEETPLTAIEFNLLRMLMENSGRVFTKRQILDSVWGDSYSADDNLVMAHIKNIRKKIEDDPANPVYLQTVWGIGYKFGEADSP